MKVAILGGGSAGLVTAHLLDEVHDVTVFEKAPILGGHVRTLNRNVPGPIAGGRVLDAGVIEFEERNFPTLMRLFASLGCDTRPVPGTTSFWSHRGIHHLSPGSVARTEESLPDRIAHHADLMGLRLQAPFVAQRLRRQAAASDTRTLGEVLGHGPLDRWMALLTTYAYSIPYERVHAVPAALAVPMLRAFLRAEGWVSLCGGSWDYLQRILDRFGGTVHVDADVTGVARDREGVTLTLASGETQRFDKVVFAVPPDQTLVLLDDPSDAEVRRFGRWRANHVEVLIHRDESLYSRRGVSVCTEFDVIETAPGHGGYNACLDALCGVPEDGPRGYGLAFGIDEWIDPAAVLHRQGHHTPDYTVDAWRWHHEVAETNGENHTFHAGAWLGDGLQEGAVGSAVAVAERLGGRSI